jgi:FKBP-type peptidyl-prolyl cis-trans isomerase 2
MSTIKNGDRVSVNYTGKLEDGSIFDTSVQEGREPLEAVLGQGMLIPGLENGLIGMSVGESKTVEIEPENAYGSYKDNMIQEVSLTQLPEGVSVGDVLMGQSQYGPTQVVVKEINSDVATLDMNHPLAGKKLIFDLEVVSVN